MGGGERGIFNHKQLRERSFSLSRLITHGRWLRGKIDQGGVRPINGSIVVLSHNGINQKENVLQAFTKVYGGGGGGDKKRR